MQIEVVLDHPVAAPQAAQDLAREPVAQKDELFSRLERVLERDRSLERFGQGGALVAPALLRNRRRRRASQCPAPYRRDRLHVRHGAPEILIVDFGRLAHGRHRSIPYPARLSRYFSASSAAMQPLDALVTAWR